MIRRYDAIITQIADSSFNRLWFYEDLTEHYKTIYPNAGVKGVKGVVRVQRLSYLSFACSLKGSHFIA